MRKAGLMMIIILATIAASAGRASAYDLKKHVVSYTLPNGMRWLFVRRTQAPVFSGVVMVRVGGIDEQPGKTGLAHMFEHMAFKGSQRLGTRDYVQEKPILDRIEVVGRELTDEEQKKRPDRNRVKKLSRELAALQKEASQFQIRNEIWEVMNRNGAADLNAYTSKDVTAYFASMPINRLELWARVTAEMAFDPAMREFYTERSVVAEERRTAVENDPNGALQEELLALAFDGGPYSISTIGYERDVNGLTIEDARDFHQRYYVPSNMIGVLVGDFSIGKAKRIVRRVFGRYAARSPEPLPHLIGTTQGGLSKRFSFNAQPALALAWHKPTLPNATEYPFDVITALLCDGRASRLEQRLIYDKRLAKDIYCSDGYPGSRLDNLFVIWIEPLGGVTPARLFREVSAEIARLRDEPVGEAELNRVRKQVTAGLVFALDENMQLAQALARFETTFGDWQILADYPRRIAAVTPEEVQRVAKTYLIPSNRIVVERLKGRAR